MQSEDDIKLLEKKIYNLENEKVKLLKLVNENENLRRENQLFQLRIDEKELKL